MDSAEKSELNEVERELIKLTDTLPLKRFCEVFGWSEGSIRSNINKTKKWQENEQYFIAPNGRYFISISGVEKWVKNLKESVPDTEKYKFTSKKKETKTTRMKRSTSPIPQLI